MPANNNPYLDPPNFGVSPTLAAATAGDLQVFAGPGPFYESTRFNSNGHGSYALVPRSGSGTSLNLGLPFPGGTPIAYFNGTQCGSIPGYNSRITSLTRAGLSVSVAGFFNAVSVTTRDGNPLSGVLDSGLTFDAATIDWGDGTVENLPRPNQVTSSRALVDFEANYYSISKAGSLPFAVTHTYAAPQSSSGIVIRASSGGYILPTLATHLPLSGDFLARDEDGICAFGSAPGAVLDSTPLLHRWAIGSVGGSGFNPGDALVYRGGATPTVASATPGLNLYEIEVLRIFLAVSGTHRVTHEVSHLAVPGYATPGIANQTQNCATLARGVAARQVPRRAPGKSPAARLASVRFQSAQIPGQQIIEVHQSFDEGHSWAQTPLRGLVSTFWNDDYTPSSWFDAFGTLFVMGRDAFLTGLPQSNGTDEFSWSGTLQNSGLSFSNPALWKYVRSFPLQPAGFCRVAVSRPDSANPTAQIWASVWYGAGAYGAPQLVGDVPGTPDELTHNQAPDGWQESHQGHSRLIVLHGASGQMWAHSGDDWAPLEDQTGTSVLGEES